jgi:Amt family ammonium transporter
MKKLLLSLCLGIGLVWAGAALAQSAEPPKDAPAAAETAAPAPAPAAAEPAAAEPAAAAAAAVTVDKGDVAWMMTATLLVILMVLPGLALFYGGLVRSKNMLSVLMQVMMVFSLITVLWAIYGYSLAFGARGPSSAAWTRSFWPG